MNWRTVAQAASPHGVISVAALTALNVPSSTIARRASAGGPWRRLLPGTISLTTGPPSPPQRIAAALCYAGDGALLTGATACWLHGLRRLPEPGGPVTVLLPHGRRRSGRAEVLVERTSRMPRPATAAGFPVAPLPRAALDAARRMGTDDDVRALLAEAVQRGLTGVRSLRNELEAGSGRGSARVRRVLAELSRGARSAAEGWAVGVAARSRVLPPLRWNPRLYTGGRFLASPDGWADDVALAWEVQSFRYHGDPDAYDRTMRRQAAMVAAGIVVVPTTPRELRADPAAALANLEAGYRQAALRVRPDVRAVG